MKRIAASYRIATRLVVGVSPFLLMGCGDGATQPTRPAGPALEMIMYVECPYGYIWQTLYDCEQHYNDVIDIWDEEDWEDYVEEHWRSGGNAVTFQFGSPYLEPWYEGWYHGFLNPEPPDCENPETLVSDADDAWCFDAHVPNDIQYSMMDTIVSSVLTRCSFLSSAWTRVRPNIRLTNGDYGFMGAGPEGGDWMILQEKAFLGSDLELLLMHELLHIYGMDHDDSPEAAYGFELQERDCDYSERSWVDVAGPYVD